MQSRLGKVIKFLFGVLVFLAIVFAVFRLFFVDFAVVGHNGMAPTMEAGDTIMVWRTTTFDIGDVAMCLNPQNPRDYVMGRVIAKQGMVVGVQRGQLVVEGTTPDIDWGPVETFTDTLTNETAPMNRGVEKLLNVYHGIYRKQRGGFRVPDVTVGPGRIYLLGDNRTHVGQDSRYFGQVIPATCRGIVFMRLKPPDESPNDLGHGWLDIIQ